MPVVAFLSGNDGLSTNPGTVSVTIPSTAAAGQVAVVVTSVNNPQGQTGPTGWTLRAGPDNNQNNLGSCVWTRTLISGDVGATRTWSAATAGRFIAAGAVLSGVTESGLLIPAPTQDTTADATLTPPTVTTSSTPPGWEIVELWCLRVAAAAAAAVSVPSTHTLDGTVSTATGASPNWTLAVSHRTGGGSASTQYGTMTASASASVTDNIYTLAFPSTSVSPVVPAATATVRAVAAAGVGPAISANPPAATAYVSARGQAPPAQYTLAALYTALGGVYVRPGPSGVGPAGTPSAPQSFRASLSGTTATLTWDVPVSDGGSAIIGYIATNLTTGVVQNLGVVLTTTFTGLTAGGAYRFAVAAVNSTGTGAGSLASVSSATAARFPGDTRPLVTGTILLGFDENDKDPTRVTPPEVAAPEALATQVVGGVTKKYQAAGVSYYFNTWTAMNVPSGAWAQAVTSQYASGRIAVGEVHITPSQTGTGDNWAQAADGRHDALIDAWIVWAEETAPDVPIPAVFSHEPNFTSTSGLTGADFGHFYRYFRSRMDLYAAGGGRGGPGVYLWKHLSLGPVFTAQNYNANNPGAAYVPDAWDGAAKITATASAATDAFTTASPHLLSNGRKVTLLNPPAGLSTTTTYYVVSAASTTLKLATTLGGSAVNVIADGSGITLVSKDVWDWAGADPYISRNGVLTPYWTANMAAFVAWSEDPAHTYPMLVREYGIYNRDPQAATKIGQFYNRMLQHDIWMALNYNSGDQGNVNNPLFTQFILDNVNNGNLLDELVRELRDPRSVRFWALTRPDGNAYPKPAGV